VLGALVMRGIMIAAGAYLIQEFHEIIYVFGAFLIVSGIRMARHSEIALEPEANPVIRLVRRILPISSVYHGQRFIVREAVEPGGRLRLVATPLLVVLLLLETTDLIFAVDSIPAVFAITGDPFIVYTSNVFAILGLRALYFLLAGVIHRFHYLKLGLAIVLVFVGTKMLISDLVHVPVGLSLGVIGVVLGGSVAASLLWPKRAAAQSPVVHDPLERGPPDPVAAPPLEPAAPGE
jgi:tellurite resistance protein TerC